jgi:WhiB family transcriptional regulator, redox-sensing transcriptional regulator
MTAAPTTAPGQAWPWARTSLVCDVAAVLAADPTAVHCVAAVANRTTRAGKGRNVRMVLRRMSIVGLVEAIDGHCPGHRICWRVTSWAVPELCQLGRGNGRQTGRVVHMPAAPARGFAGDWTARAACAGSDPALWFPREEQHGGNAAAMAAEAVRICRGCPVRAECSATAADAGERWGIWGGADRETRTIKEESE